MKVVYSSASRAESASAGLGFSATYFSVGAELGGPGGRGGAIQLLAASCNSFGLPQPVDSARAYAHNYTWLVAPAAVARPNDVLHIQFLDVSINNCGEWLDVLTRDTSALLIRFTCSDNLSSNSTTNIDNVTVFKRCIVLSNTVFRESEGPASQVAFVLLSPPPASQSSRCQVGR